MLPRPSLFIHDRIGYLLGSVIEMSCLATDVQSHFALPIVVGNSCGIWYHLPIVGDAIVYLVNIDHFLIALADMVEDAEEALRWIQVVVRQSFAILLVYHLEAGEKLL